MSFKQKIYNHCTHLVNENINSLQNNLNDLMEGAKSDSKSSAGDKHETSISMMQLEQEKVRKQLNEALEQKAELDKININVNNNRIAKGSLVKANNMFLFISIALGKITIDNKQIIILSSQSPLGIKLMGKQKNDTAEINGRKYLIETIE